MRILHVGDIANVPLCLRNIDRNNGIESDVLKTYPCYINYESDYDIPMDKYDLRSFLNVFKYLKFGLKYDRIHMHFKLPIGFEILFFKLMGKEVYMHYHGSEIRNKRMPLLHNLCDKYYVSTPDLLEFAPVMAKYLPNPFDISELDYQEYKLHNPIKIIHAPTNREVKGTNRIIQVIQRLKFEGYDIDFELIEGLDHKSTIEKIKNADIVIDQIKIGTYGIFAQEAMYLGKPVMAYINPKYTINPPIINSDEIRFYVEMKKVLDMNENQLKEIGLAGRKYVIEKHVYDEY